MSLIATAASASASPTIGFHLHGHKKGVHSASGTDSGSSGTDQSPATTQGLFSTLLQSLEQIIGVPAIVGATAVPAASATTAAAAGASSATTASAAPSATASGQSANAALQGFLNNLLQTVQSTGGRSLSSLGNRVDGIV